MTHMTGGSYLAPLLSTLEPPIPLGQCNPAPLCFATCQKDLYYVCTHHDGQISCRTRGGLPPGFMLPTPPPQKKLNLVVMTMRL